MYRTLIVILTMIAMMVVAVPSGYAVAKKPVAKNVVSQQEKPIVATLANGSRYERKKIKTSVGAFLTDVITVDVSKPGIAIVTDTASTVDCKADCPAKSLKEFIEARHAFAGIHGAYFCPPDYAFCKEKVNYSFYPFYNTEKQFLINEGELKWIQGSLLAFDTTNAPLFFLDARTFGRTKQAFELRTGSTLRALISNAPALINQGNNVVLTQSMDTKQRTVKSLRGGIGVKGNIVYFVIAQKATVPDLASVMEVLGIQEALNLDGGGSSALWWNGVYKAGPGRNLPNAILVIDSTHR